MGHTWQNERLQTEVGIGDWDPRDPCPGTGTGTGNLKIWGRGQGWGQSLGDGDRAGDTKFKSGDWGQGRGLKIEKMGTGERNGDWKIKSGDPGQGRGPVKFLHSAG